MSRQQTWPPVCERCGARLRPRVEAIADADPPGVFFVSVRLQCDSCGLIRWAEDSERGPAMAAFLEVAASDALELLKRSIDAAACRSIDALPPGEVFDRQADRIEERANRMCDAVDDVIRLLREYRLEAGM